MTLRKADLKNIARSIKATDHSESRLFLHAIYTEAKSQDPSYSYTRLSEDLGVGSKNAHPILNGKRPLTLKSAGHICEALGLAGLQKKYFLTMVKQERARTTEDRDAAFQERLQLRQKELPTELGRSQLAFFEHWYHVAILETLRLEHASDDAEWIADHIRPEVPAQKIKESLVLLKELGYIKKDKTRRRLYPTDASITTGNEVIGLAVLSFHRQMLKLSMDALDSIDREDRDISAVTLSVTAEVRELMKEEIIALRKRFVSMSVDTKNPDEVVQLNLQLFPLVKKGA